MPGAGDGCEDNGGADADSADEQHFDCAGHSSPECDSDSALDRFHVERHMNRHAQ